MYETIYHWVNALWPVWLSILFVGIVARAFWPSRKGEMEAHGRIPLEDDREG